MTRKLLGALAPAVAVLATAISLAAQPAAESVRSAPPPTRADGIRETLHGVEIPDPYRWLEDQEAPETRAWIEQQNAYAESLLGGRPGREKLKARLTQLLKVDIAGIPVERGGRYFYTRRLASRELPIVYVREGRAGPERVLIDPHPLSADRTTSVSLLDVSRDGKLVAYGIRQGGEDEVTVKLRDAANGKDLADTLPRARYSGVAIDRDRTGLYYSRVTESGPRVFFHAIGSDPSRDAKLFGDGYGPDKIIGVGLSEDGRYLSIIVSHGSAAVQTEVYVRDLARKDSPLRTVVNDVKARFDAQIAGDRLYLATNWDAPNGRLFRADLAQPSREHWKEIIPAGRSPIQGYSPVGGKLFVRYLENVVPRVRAFDPDGRPAGEVSLPGIGSVNDLQGRWGSREAFFAFSSFVVPQTIYRYDTRTKARRVWARQRVPIASDRFTVEQVRYASKDGTQVPMFLVRRKDLRLDGSNPTLLTGYGGFTLSQTPAFAARAAAWVERGGVYALAALRGGGEFGEEWHRAGMLEKKQNVFDDFLGAAEWLIARRYTSPERLAISGGSNGGLLVGAAMTQRPDLFAAVVCSYPLLDMLRYQRFLVARYWVPEYGSAEDPEQFRYLRAYSPYHRVEKGTRYPAVLFITGDADTRVAPLHARKMTALLQASTADPEERPVILHYDTKAGHSRGINTPVSKQIDDLTDELSFLFWQLKMEA